MNSKVRVADMLVRLMAGETLGFSADAGVFVRTFQRDLVTIRPALAARSAGELVETKAHHWHLVRQGERENLPLVSGISSILLGSRSLTTAEMTEAFTFVQARLSSDESYTVNTWLTQEKEDYQPIAQAQPLIAKLDEAIASRQRLTFTYQSPGQSDSTVCAGQPVTMYFERFYFYVAMFVREQNRDQLFRLDRIHQILTEENGEMGKVGSCAAIFTAGTRRRRLRFSILGLMSARPAHTLRQDHDTLSQAQKAATEAQAAQVTAAKLVQDERFNAALDQVGFSP